jgi:hypothetical protein
MGIVGGYEASGFELQKTNHPLMSGSFGLIYKM